MRKMNHFFIILLFIFPLIALAKSVDRTIVRFTNNSYDTITISATAYSDDKNFKENVHWKLLSNILPPLKSVDVLWLQRNLGLKPNHQYKVILNFRKEYSEPSSIEFDLQGKKIFGSEVKTFLKNTHYETREILKRNGIEKYSIDCPETNFDLYVRTYKPLISTFNSYHFVYDGVNRNIKAPSTEEPNKISVLTYNTQLMPPIAATYNDLNQPKLRAAEIPVFLKRYDVVIFQELYDDDLRQRIILGMTDTFPYHSVVTGSHTKKPYPGGTMIFSKWPIQAQHDMVYMEGYWLDDLAAKGAVHVMLNKQGKIYHVFGTHLQSADTTIDIETRAKQLRELRNFIDNVNPAKDQPVIIGGDFNVNQFSDEINILKDLLEVNIPLTYGYKYSFDPKTNEMNLGVDSERIDFVFYGNRNLKPKTSYNTIFPLRDLTAEQMWPEFELSDHYAVAGFFEF